MAHKEATENLRVATRMCDLTLEPAVEEVAAGLEPAEVGFAGRRLDRLDPLWHRG